MVPLLVDPQHPSVLPATRRHIRRALRLQALDDRWAEWLWVGVVWLDERCGVCAWVVALTVFRSSDSDSFLPLAWRGQLRRLITRARGAPSTPSSSLP